MDFETFRRYDEVDILSRMLSDAIESAIVNNGDRAKWRRSLEAGKIVSWYALFLPRLRNLKSITVSYNTKPTHHKLHGLLKRASEGQEPFESPAFPFLRHATIITGDIDVNIADLAPYFKLRSMRRISIRSSILSPRASFSGDTTHPIIGLPKGTSTVTELHLRKVVFDKHVVVGLIRCCKELKSFTLRAQYVIPPTVLLSIYSLLKRRAGTLESVCIDATNHTDPYHYRGYFKYLGPFSRYSKLKSLHLPLICFINIASLSANGATIRLAGPSETLKDLLPASLEELIVCVCKEVDILDAFMPKLESLISDAELYTPDLRRIALYDVPDSRFYLLAGIERESHDLSEVCREKQISFTWSEECCEYGEDSV